MICIYDQFLSDLGFDFTEIEATRALAPAIITSPCFSFDAGGGAHPHGLSMRDWLLAEPDPRHLVLIGMADRYGAAEKIGGVNIQSFCVGTYNSATPTAVDLREIRSLLERVPGAGNIVSAIDAKLGKMSPSYLVVTRHKSLVQYLREQGHVGSDARVIEHATESDVTDEHVIGILPMRLAALCASYSECPLDMGPHDRGVNDLPIERIREIAQPLTSYVVRRV